MSPGGVLASNVTVGDQSFIGPNEFIGYGIKSGANLIIGTSAVVEKKSFG
jgi:acetyltransferase-like isoleucine patch superfamily enzyme